MDQEFKNRNYCAVASFNVVTFEDSLSSGRRNIIVCRSKVDCGLTFMLDAEID